MLGIKNMQSAKANPVLFLLKAINIVQQKTNATSFNITIDFNEKREIAGFGISRLPPEIYAEIEKPETRKWTDFVDYTSGGGVCVDEQTLIPLNTKIKQQLNDLILWFLNDPKNHWKKEKVVK